VKLESYSGLAIRIVGETTVNVYYRAQEVDLPFIVHMEKSCPYGKRLVDKIKLDWPQSCNVQQASPPKPKFQDIGQQYPKLKAIENAPLQYFKPHPVPYMHSCRDEVESEVKRLESEGVLTKVEITAWATPILPLLKPDETVIICGDFKVTFKPYLDVPEYSGPTPEELITKMS